MAACVQATTAAAQPTRKRVRVAMGNADDYEETCRLGEGAFGSVVKARQRGTGEAVAIKHLGAALGGHGALLREAQFLEASGRDNPFVAGFHGLARDPATMALSLVMEFVGPNLRDLLRRHRRSSRNPPVLPEATMRAAMWQLLTGVSKTHERGVIHRDIKPSNILVGGANLGAVVKMICDFGLPMSMDEPPPREPAGTLCYMAPEMLLEKPDYDERVDAWSLGCVMAELVNGWNPFQGLNEEGQLCAIFDVLGLPDGTTWPWFSSTEFADEVVPDPDERRYRHNHLREDFPETKLSTEGFEVLSGLLTCNPDKRLTAAAALEQPWFAKVDALELSSKREEVASPDPSALPKRRRVLCA